MNLVWRGPVTDPSGYAAGGRAFLRGLVEEGARVRLEPNMWNAREAIDRDERRALVELSETELPSVDASVQHTVGRLFDPYMPGRVRVGRTMFETDRIPADWVARCNSLDEIWVPTEHNREAFAAAGVDPGRLAVVPEPFELDRLDRRRGPARHARGPRHRVPRDLRLDPAEGMGRAAVAPGATPSTPTTT